MPGEVSRNMPAADLSPEEHEEFDVWRRSREAIARALADVEDRPWLIDSAAANGAHPPNIPPDFRD